VVFCADKSYAIALMPADRELDLEELADHLGVSKIRLATESEVAKLAPDSEVGAMPPFGTLFNMPVYIDQRLGGEKFIVFSAGTHRDAIHMRLGDYLRLADPLILRCSRRHANAA